MALEDDVDAALSALLGAMTVAPTQLRAAYMRRLIRDLMVAGVWSKLDLLYVFAAHDQQAARVNWKAPANYLAAAEGSPTFTVDDGFTGNGTSARLNSGVAMKALPGYSLNSRHVGAWIASGPDLNNYVVGTSAAGSRTLLRPRGDTGFMAAALGPSTYTASALGMVPSRTGHFVGTRSDATNITGYYNGSFMGSSAAQPATDYDAGSITFLSWAGAGFTTDKIRVGHIGAGLTGGETASFYQALQRYMSFSGIKDGAAALSSAGASSVAARSTRRMASNLSGRGNVTVDGRRWRPGQTACCVVGRGTLSAGGTRRRNAASAAGGRGSAVLFGARSARMAAVASGATTAAATVTRRAIAGSDLANGSEAATLGRLVGQGLVELGGIGSATPMPVALGGRGAVHLAATSDAVAKVDTKRAWRTIPAAGGSWTNISG